MLTKCPVVGKLIVFEGLDNVGKTSISKEIATYLNENGEFCELISFPCKESGTISKLIYDLCHKPIKYGVEDLTSINRQTLHLVAHLDSIERCILPILKSGRHVILNRFWWSTWVYGVVSGINQKVLESIVALERSQWEDIKPSIAILLHCQAPTHQNEDLQYWKNLRREYDLLVNKEREHYPVLFYNNVGSVENITDSIKAILQEKLNASDTRNSTYRKTLLEGQLSFNLEDFTEHQSPARRSASHSHLLPIKATVVFDTYWRFAAERQKIFFKKFTNSPMPWTNDPILSTYKFTNAYRASDRTSQYLIRHVIYRDDLPCSPEEVFFRIILFKLFNKIETWKLLEGKLGYIVYENYSFNLYDQILTETIEKGQTIYSAAYIMPSGSKVLGHTRKHRNHLKLIEQMMVEELPKRLANAETMHEGFDLLRTYPTLGDFLAYQYITDINYSEITNFSEMSFVVPGPGALDGIRKCFTDLGGLNEPEIIKLMADSQESEFERLGLEFHSLFGRPLQLIDCQNLFCEVDKYSRMKHPEIAGISGRTRIKQKYSANWESFNCWYPPKWGINEAVKEYQEMWLNASHKTKLEIEGNNYGFSRVSEASNDN